METVLFWAVVAVVIVGWILFRKRRKSRGGAGEQEQVSQEITIINLQRPGTTTTTKYWR